MQITIYHIHKPSFFERAQDRIKALIGEAEIDMGKVSIVVLDFLKNEYKIQKSLAKGDWYKLKNLFLTSLKRIRHKVRSGRTNQISATSGEIVLQKRYYSTFAKILAISGVTLIAIVFAPSGWYFLSSRLGIERNTKVIAETVKTAEAANISIHQVSVYQPDKDASLPQEPRLIIPSAGIDTRIHEATEQNFEEALKKGVWRVNDFGTPYDREKPIILAAHRFGYLKWSIPYRLKNSFYNLPKSEVGDTVEIIWNQRKYTFAIYAQEEGEQITDYSADLVLYTCKDLESDVRLFKYAKLIEI